MSDEYFDEDDDKGSGGCSCGCLIIVILIILWATSTWPFEERYQPPVANENVGIVPDGE